MQTRDVILVIDDDPVFLRSIGRLLEIHKFDARAFASPEAFQSALIPAETVCILLDINLGEISGIEIRRQLTRSGVLTPVIYMTASCSESRHEAASASGCVSILVKPFGSALLLNAIQTARASLTQASAEILPVTRYDPEAN